MEQFSDLYTPMYSLNLPSPDSPKRSLNVPARGVNTGRMEVASLSSEDDSTGNASKRLLQGRPLPSILVDNHPGPQYPSFRPPQRRLSVQKGWSQREGVSTPGDSGLSLSSSDADAFYHTSATSKSPVRSTSKVNRKKKRHLHVPAGLLSGTSSGVSSGRISEQLHRRAPHRVSRLHHYGRATAMEGIDYSVNPEPVPFMPSNFMSSTMVKRIPIPKRHQDTFGGYEYNFTGQRGVVLHTDRYQSEALKSFEGLNQRERLVAEMAYLEELRGIRRRREVLPHRVQLDLFLGGRKMDCEERFDIRREIQKLKAVAMPTRARDLFHGKGIALPSDHMSVVPRLPPQALDGSDSEEEVQISAPASMQRVAGQSLDLQSPTFERQISLTLGELPRTRSIVRGKRYPQLPSLNTTHTPRAGAQQENISTQSIPVASWGAAWSEEQAIFSSKAPTPETTSLTGSIRGSRLELEVHLPKGSHADDVDLDQETAVKNRDLSSSPTRKTAAPDQLLTETEVNQQQEQLSADINRGDSSRAPLPVIPTASCPDLSPLSSTQDAVLIQSAAQTGAELKQLQTPAFVPQDERQWQLGSRQESPQVPNTPNPLQAGMGMDVPEELVSDLRQMFQRLDTDMDGHLQYHQLKSQLPKEFSHQQEWFVRQVYEITRSSAAFFGVDEFLMMTQLTNRVASLTGVLYVVNSGQAQEAYGKINFDTLEETIIRYVDLFQSADSAQKGRISVDTFRELIGRSQNRPVPDENSHLWNTIMDSLSLDYASQVNRIEYLAHIPLFMLIAPLAP